VNNFTPYLPAISDATFPNAVVVVVAAIRTPCLSFLNRRLGFTALPLAVGSCMVSDRPGMSEEFLYSATSDLTANFWSAIRSALSFDS
jgi:hypothetical protein